MKRIVYIRASNMYDDSRATKEIGALLENDYEVIVLGWNRNGEAENMCRELFSAYAGKITYIFFQVRINGNIGMKHLHHLFMWLVWVYKCVRNLGKIDAVHASNLDATLSIWHYCKRHKIKLIYDIFDYYVDSHMIPKCLKNFIEKLEINIINNADLTIICTEERREQISKSNPNEVLVIHNSPDVEIINEVTEKYDYVYCGSLFSGRLIKETFQKYPQNQDLHLGIAGYGEFEKDAINLQERYSGFTYFGTIPYSDVLHIESESKVISAIYEPNVRNHRLCAPNKFYEALALGKPVIVCRGTGIDKIVEKYNLGAVINYDADEFYSAIRMLIQDKQKRYEIGMRARRLYEQEYKWQIMKERMLSCYSRIVGK